MYNNNSFIVFISFIRKHTTYRRERIVMDKILTKAVWKMRQEDNCKQGKDVNVTLIKTGRSSYQIYFPSRGCRYACTMCNYGFRHPVREREILQELDTICNNLEDASNSIVILESSGSFLDEKELPEELQEKIMKRIARTDLPEIQIETHYRTITKRKVERIKEIFKSKNIVFELGLESTSPEVLKIYNKAIDLEQLLKTIWFCHENGIVISLNVMLGAPLLTIHEQIVDTVHSVKWILDNCPKDTSIVLFPLNIKDFTLVKHMYKQGRYSVVYDWAFIEVLRKIPQGELHRVYISWYGNRCNEFHGEQAIIKPYHCNKCENELENFYRSFVGTTDAVQKSKLIKEISSFKCQCKDEFLRLKSSQKAELCYTERLEEEKNLLIKELNL